MMLSPLTGQMPFLRQSLTGPHERGDEPEPGHRAALGSGIGSVAGAVIGACAAAVAATVATLQIPGIGAVEADAFMMALLGGAAGAINGGLAGSLVGWSIPCERNAGLQAVPEPKLKPAPAPRRSLFQSIVERHTSHRA